MSNNIALPSTPEGIGELWMHHTEAMDWINALEWWIRRQGLDVPTWRDVEKAGWTKNPT